MPRPNSLIHKLINEERRRRGVPPVRWNEELYYMAKQQADYCARVGKLVHCDDFAFNDGEGLHGENLCGGRGNMTPTAIVNSWLKSKAGHRENLLNPQARSAAVAISKSRHGTYCAWEFSDRAVREAHPCKARGKRSLLSRISLALRRFWGL